MKKFSFFALVIFFILAQITVKAQNIIWFSPLTFSTGNPNIMILPGNPSTSIVVITKTAGDQQWIDLGLNIPSNQKIDSVLVYYQISDSLSYITRVRLTRMTTPDAAYIIHDDGTDLTSTVPTYYSSYVGGQSVNGAITLSLRLNYSDTHDFIIIGAIAIVVSAATNSVAKQQINSIVDYNLGQNYPNPFNPSTTINYTVPVTSNVQIDIFDLNGRLVKTLINKTRNAGDHSVSWDGKDNSSVSVSTGTYFYQVRVGSFVQAKKMLLIK